MFSYFNDVRKEQNSVETNSNHLASGSSASYTTPTKKESVPKLRPDPSASYINNDELHRDVSLEKEEQGFLSGYRYGKNDIDHQQLPHHNRNDSDSNSSTEDSHNRRVALMMASPARSPHSNSSWEKQRRRTRPPIRRTSSGANGSLSQPLQLDGSSEGYGNDIVQSPLVARRRTPKSLSATVSPTHRRRSSDRSHISEYSTTEISSESSPDTSPSRQVSDMYRHDDLSPQKQHYASPRLSLSGKRRSRSSNESISSFTDSYDPKSTTRKSPTKKVPSPRAFKSVRTKSSTSNKNCSLAGSFFGIIIISMIGMVVLTRRAVPMTLSDKYFDENLFNLPTVRGKHHLGGMVDYSPIEGEDALGGRLKRVGSRHENNVKRTRYSALTTKGTVGKNSQLETKKTSNRGTTVLPQRLQIQMPTSTVIEAEPKFDDVDRNIYYLSKSAIDSEENDSHPRTVMLDPRVERVSRKIEIDLADFTDNTQFYGVLPSDDERLNRMEMREPYSKNECVPMQKWQTTYQPSCNGMHELALQTLGASTGAKEDKHGKNRKIGEVEGLNATLFGTKGFWRYAWKLVIGHNDHERAETDTIVFKNLKYEHNFEDAHFEHDRVDAVAMERLTSSPHVINIFGFCGHSVMTEYADGKRVGELADKAKKIPLKRLEIARDIASGLADVHGIDGDGNTTFVHLDINPANVVSVNRTLKLNDFNIGIIRQWNTTSNEPCGFPAQYPNPQWRSPEEARNEQHLTEKVDVFSLGHIFFRLICEHEPWNKLEPGGKPTKAVIDEKVRRGELPFIPDHVRNSKDPEVVAIRDIMLKCYSFDPTERPSARYVANTLDRAFEDLKKKNSKKASKEKKDKKKAKAKTSTKIERVNSFDAIS